MSNTYMGEDGMEYSTVTINNDNEKKFKMYPSQWVFVTFQKEGLHRWPDAHKYPGYI